MGADETTDGFQERSRGAQVGYVVAAAPDLAKVADGVVHLAADDAFGALDALPGHLAKSFAVYEAMVFVASAPMRRPE